MEIKEQLDKNSSSVGKTNQAQILENLSPDSPTNNKFFFTIIFIMLLLVVLSYLFYQNYSISKQKDSGTEVTSAIKTPPVTNQPLSTSSQISLSKPELAKYVKLSFPETSSIKRVPAKSLVADLEFLVFSNATEIELNKIEYKDHSTGVILNYNTQLTVTDFFKKFNNISGLTILGGSYTEVLGTFDYQYNSKNLRVTATANDKGGISAIIQTIND